MDTHAKTEQIPESAPPLDTKKFLDAVRPCIDIAGYSRESYVTEWDGQLFKSKVHLTHRKPEQIKDREYSYLQKPEEYIIEIVTKLPEGRGEVCRRIDISPTGQITFISIRNPLGVDVNTAVHGYKAGTVFEQLSEQYPAYAEGLQVALESAIPELQRIAQEAVAAKLQKTTGESHRDLKAISVI